MALPQDAGTDTNRDESAPELRRLSRRRMIGGAGAAVAVALVARATPADAASGQALISGANNNATTPTTLTEVGTAPAFKVTGNNGPALSVELAPAAAAQTLTIGVAGAGDATALSANPTTGTAVLAGNTGTGDVAIGVLGSSGPAGPVSLAPMGAGVAGRAAPRGDNSGTVGVLGLLGTQAIPGTDSMSAAVAGLSGGADAGVVGESLSGIGVRGVSFGAQSAVQAVGSKLALDVRGVARFNRSGSVTIKGTASTAVVTVPGGVTAATLAFANLQTNLPDVYVRAVVPQPGTGKLTIVLNKAPGSVGSVARSVKAAWFVVG